MAAPLKERVISKVPEFQMMGWGMAPRGEVGLIFAMVGKQLGVVSESMFSVIIMVILTTLVTPLVLMRLLRGVPKP